MADQNGPSGSGLSKILLATDGSEASKFAARYAGELARAMGGVVIAVHVTEAPFDYKAYGLGADTIKRIREDLVKSIDDKLTATLEACGEGIETERRILEGDPFEEIVRAAADESVDLIVLATHGYSGVKHFLLGSTAERVVRLAECPVLTVREGQDLFAS